MKLNRLRARGVVAAAVLPILLTGCAASGTGEQTDPAEAGQTVQTVETGPMVASAEPSPTKDAGGANVEDAASAQDRCSQLDFSAVLEVYPKLEGPRTKTREGSEMFDCVLNYPEGYAEQVIATEGLDETLHFSTQGSFGMHFNFTPPDPSVSSRKPVEEWDLANLPASEIVTTPAGRKVLISMRADGVPGYEGYSQAQYDMVDDEGWIFTAMTTNFASHSPGAATVDAAVLETLDGLAESI